MTNKEQHFNCQQRASKPRWLHVRISSGDTFESVHDLISEKSLNTICEEALCPNLSDCWACGTATFLILGSICTRSCLFCSIKKGMPGEPEQNEPDRVSEAVQSLELRHVVVTSVTRDDLTDGGAANFQMTIQAIHESSKQCRVEVLVPDFKGNDKGISTVLRAQPEVFGHNIETIPRLYPQVIPKANYSRSLRVLETAKKMAPETTTKSGIMVGLGETVEEIYDVMNDLKDVGCDIITIGQYLQPSPAQLKIARYYTPKEFHDLEIAGYQIGFRAIASGPLVRSSYKAGILYQKARLNS